MDDQGVTRGLSLLPDEVQIFSKDFIEAAIGIGEHPKSRDFEIILYQLTTDACPKLKEKGCSVYKIRPVSCRQFPLSLNIGKDEGLLLGYDLNCPSILACNSTTIQNTMRSEIKAAEKHFNNQVRILREENRVWIFDLMTKRWVKYRILTPIYQ
jgi:Fe-S-cluster containining protein